MTAIHSLRRLRCLLVVFVVGCACLQVRLGAIDSAAVKKLFADPPREYATAPLWVWNDMLTEQQIRDTMRDLAGQKVKQVFVHPRPGLMTPYLSADWFRLWKVALDEAAKLDMNVWIYDENSYPSGFAGGHVPELMPESRGMGLSIKEAATAPKWEASTIRVFRSADSSDWTDVSDAVRRGDSLPASRYLVAQIVRSGNSPWHGNRSYVNLLTPGVTEKFIEVTLEAYKREVGDQFGKRIPGIFTDEPNIRPAGGFPWCPDLPEQFQKRWGYSLLDVLPALTRPVGDWRRVRHNYHATLNALFIERWGQPFYEWCEKNGVDFTGHYWDHEWPHCSGVPDNMAMAAWQQRPGVDTLMNQYAEHTHAQFGNVRYCREVSSLANQLGRKRTLVELYGAGGWDLRFEDMKRIGDWLQVLGVNTMDEHLSYITIRGARKRDHPQSFSYHEPWWPAYHVNAQYLARLSAALSQGQQFNRVLVIEPTTTAWMYQGDEARLSQLGDAFMKLLMALEREQIEYDLGCEDVIARYGSVRTNAGKAVLQIGQRAYDLVVIPPLNENLDERTRELLDLRHGVQRVWIDAPAQRSSGRALPDRRDAERHSWQSVAADGYRIDTFMKQIRDFGQPRGLRIQRATNDSGILFHHRRHIDDGEILFLVNTSLEAPSAGTFESDLKGVEQWNLQTGAVEGYPFTPSGRGVKASFHLPPAGSLMLFLSKESRTPAALAAGKPSVIPPDGVLEIIRMQPNVLTLDYVDITVGGESLTNAYFYQAQQFAFRKNGMDRNPWDSAVQFKDELIKREFPANSGFTASYKFTIEGSVPRRLAIAIERPDLYRIECNGQPVTPDEREFYLDRVIRLVNLRGVARTGENVVTLRATPFTIYHELEPAYLLGSFSLKPVQRGFVVVPDRTFTLERTQLLPEHSINSDGTMWLSGGIGFEKSSVNDRQPWVQFDLGQPVELSAVRVWNYGEAHVRDLTGRGTAKMRVLASANETFAPGSEASVVMLPRVSGKARPEEIPLKRTARFVKFEMLANHHGVIFPPTGEVPDNGFVGLSEVQFLDAQGQVVRGVRVTASSELASHQRQARHLVDGSGLDGARPGWNTQGSPFYSGRVAYRNTFRVAQPAGRYRVALPSWNGSIAEVRVNGKSAGHIVSAPYELDVTSAMRSGLNSVEVEVIGTLKNTLGPHHGNPPAGAAWPHMFQQGPKNGPPPGNQYSTFAYGLFEPFTLTQVAP